MYRFALILNIFLICANTHSPVCRQPSDITFNGQTLLTFLQKQKFVLENYVVLSYYVWILPDWVLLLLKLSKCLLMNYFEFEITYKVGL